MKFTKFIGFFAFSILVFISAPSFATVSCEYDLKLTDDILGKTDSETFQDQTTNEYVCVFTSLKQLKDFKKVETYRQRGPFSMKTTKRPTEVTIRLPATVKYIDAINDYLSNLKNNSCYSVTNPFIEKEITKNFGFTSKMVYEAIIKKNKGSNC